jgi:hypothetical protein
LTLACATTASISSSSATGRQADLLAVRVHPSTSFSMSKRIVPAIAYATTSGGEARKACFAYGWMRPSKLRLPDRTAVAYRSRSMISCWITGSSAPDMPLQVVQAKATTPKPSCSSSGSRPASSRYSATAFEPGASELFTHGLRSRPSGWRYAPAGRGDHVARVVGVGAAGDRGDDDRAVRHQARLVLDLAGDAARASSDVGTRLCGFDGPAMLRTTDDRSKCSTRSYSAVFRLSAHRPVCFA